MSRLLLDLGNTRIKAARLESEGLCRPQARVWPAGEERAETVLATIRGHRPEAVWVCSVLGRDLARAVQSSASVPVRFVEPEETERLGIRLGYTEPSALGVDRAVGLLGAWLRTAAACIVVDCGTAVTVDALDARGRHRGGVILPGVRAMQAALGASTQGVGMPAAGRPACPPALARDTRSAVAAGACRAVVAGVETAVAEMREAVGRGARVLACGGDAHWLAGRSRLPMEVVPHLVLEGLAEMVDA